MTLNPLGLLAFVVVQLLTLGSALSQDFPTKPIKLISPYAAGGGTDMSLRLLSDRLQQKWGQPVLIENKPGGGGNVGADFVFHAQADGYTLLLVSSSQVGNAALLEKTTFDLVNDFAPVGLVSSSPIVIAVNNRVKANTFKEFIALLKTEAGKVDYASCGIATTHHFAMELLKYQTGTKAQHIPYKCASAVNDLLGNQLDVIAVTLPPALPFIQQGKMRALAVTSAKRSPNALGIPTVSESGLAELKDYAVENYYGFVAHAGIPKAVLKKLEADVKTVSLDPSIQSKLAGAGLDAFYKTPEQTSALLSSDIEFYKKMSKVANIKQE